MYLHQQEVRGKHRSVQFQTLVRLAERERERERERDAQVLTTHMHMQQQQVILKLKSKHIGGALTKKNKSRSRHLLPKHWIQPTSSLRTSVSVLTLSA
jgi:hypothetical protein